ncbi:Glycerol kinase [Streptomyces sp. enrichment culture]
MLVNLETLPWDPSVLSAMRIPEALLPEIRSSAEVHGTAVGRLAGVPVASALGDRQAAVFGRARHDAGTAKNTCGTGSLLPLDTGARPVPSNGLLTTLGHKTGDEAPVHCLEGAVALTGALVQLTRHQADVLSTCR